MEHDEQLVLVPAAALVLFLAPLEHDLDPLHGYADVHGPLLDAARLEFVPHATHRSDDLHPRGGPRNLHTANVLKQRECSGRTISPFSPTFASK